MAKFRFPLQRLLEQRLREEREKQCAVAECEMDRVAVEGEIRKRQRGIGECKIGLRDALNASDGSAFDATAVRLQARASLHLTLQTRQLAIQLAGIHRRLETTRGILLKATIRRKVVETLRDRQFEQWRQREAKREANELDEVAAALVRRRSCDSMEVI